MSGNVLASSLRISAEQLNDKLDSVIVILDTRAKNDYDIDHIAGAISFPEELTYYDKKTNGRIQLPNVMQKLIRERGLETVSEVVVYDNGELVSAARLFWVLEVFGFTNVKILDRGYSHWRKKGFPISQLKPVIKPSDYVATVNHQRLASKFATLLATKSRDKTVIDARPRPAYEGKVSVAKRFGHIPTAINVPYDNNFINEDGVASFQTIEELKNLYADVPRDKKVIIYCKIGKVSSANYFALRELGHDVANYDASWREWGNDDELPIEK